MVIRAIRELLYDKGFTIGGARQQLEAGASGDTETPSNDAIKMIINELEDVIRVLRA